MANASIVFLLVGITLVVVMIFALRQHLQMSNKVITGGAEKPKYSPKPSSKPSNPDRATSITCGKTSCAAVKAIEGKRFLVLDDDIPALPLPACDENKCKCKYIHHEDRREKEDRRSISGAKQRFHLQTGNVENRKKRGRRKSDWE